MPVSFNNSNNNNRKKQVSELKASGRRIGKARLQTAG